MLPFRFFFQRKRSEIVIDEAKFKPGEGKVIEVWNWKLLRTEKYVVHLRPDGKITIEKVGD
ncbi:MAG: hypothetical protein MW690_000779 [Methanophagales archaeon]|nr:hypothetical protein [Methanophagales archaeon]MCU4139889.1 hypothetical protein [Methanophagales archaeon]